MATNPSKPAAVIPIARPWMDAREVEAAKRAILSGWVTQGPEVAAFEREFADTVGAGLACAVSSGTAALHLALVALGVTAGDEVVTVSHSFIATANAIRYCGATPVFVDIDPTTFNIDPALVEAALSPRTRALLLVHQLGMPCQLDLILPIAARHGIPVVEDAACAIGSEIYMNARWERIGRPHGAIACFSFHPRKILSTGDGGMIATSDAQLASAVKRLRQHGMSVPDTVRHSSASVVFEDYDTVGFNYRMTDIQAAIGREQLIRLPEIIARRRLLAARYTQALANVPGILTPHEPSWARSNWQTYAIRIGPRIDQRSFMQRLLEAGIATRRGVMNAHTEKAYPASSWRAAGSLERSERARDTTVALPLFHHMTEHDQDYVVDVVRREAGA